MAASVWGATASWELFSRNLFWPPGHPAAWPGAVLVEGGQTSFQLSDWPLYNEAFVVSSWLLFEHG